MPCSPQSKPHTNKVQCPDFPNLSRTGQSFCTLTRIPGWGSINLGGANRDRGFCWGGGQICTPSGPKLPPYEAYTSAHIEVCCFGGKGRGSATRPPRGDTSLSDTRLRESRAASSVLALPAGARSGLEQTWPKPTHPLAGGPGWGRGGEQGNTLADFCHL